MKDKSRAPWESGTGLAAFRAGVCGLRAAGGVGAHQAKSEHRVPAEVMMYGMTLNWGKKAGIFAKRRGTLHGWVAAAEAEKESGFSYARPREDWGVLSLGRWSVTKRSYSL